MPQSGEFPVPLTPLGKGAGAGTATARPPAARSRIRRERMVSVRCRFEMTKVGREYLWIVELLLLLLRLKDDADRN